MKAKLPRVPWHDGQRIRLSQTSGTAKSSTSAGSTQPPVIPKDRESTAVATSRTQAQANAMCAHRALRAKNIFAVIVDTILDTSKATAVPPIGLMPDGAVNLLFCFDSEA